MDKKRKCKVLIADDDKFIRDRLEMLFTREGWDVLAVKNGEMALSALKEGGIDIAVLDVYMEGITGSEVVNQARENNIKIPLIVITGDDSLDVERQVREKGVYAYFLKPLELEILVRTIQAALGIKQRVI